MCSWLKPIDFNCWIILERDGHESQVLELELFVHELKVHRLDAFCESSPKSEGIDTHIDALMIHKPLVGFDDF